MAVITTPLITVGPDGSIFRLSATYEDTSGRIDSLDAVNNDTLPHTVRVYYQRGNQAVQTFDTVVPAAVDGVPGTASYVPPANVKWGSERFDIALAA